MWLCGSLSQLTRTVPVCQAVKLESSADSALPCMLLRRALRSPQAVGHPLFWHLRAELHVPRCHTLVTTLLAAFLTFAGSSRRQLLLQVGEGEAEAPTSVRATMSLT